MEPSSDLDRFWNSIPALLEQQQDGKALRAILQAGIAGYTRQEDTPKGLLIRHNPDGTRHLVKINIDGPDTVIQPL